MQNVSERTGGVIVRRAVFTHRVDAGGSLMSATGSGPLGRRARPRVEALKPGEDSAAFARTVRGALEGYLKGRLLVKVKIRQVEGAKVEGFLKIKGEKGDRVLVDFEATRAPDGGLSSLEVGGRKISLG